MSASFFCRMQRFYAQHNPAQLSQVDSILKKYAGKHELLFRSLHKKYEVDPDPLEVRSLFVLREHSDGAALFIIPTLKGQRTTLLWLHEQTNSLPISGGLRKFSLRVLDSSKSIEAQNTAAQTSASSAAIVVVYVLLKYQEFLSQPNQLGVSCSVFCSFLSLSLSL